MSEVLVSNEIYDFVSEDDFNIIAEKEMGYFTENDLINEIEEMGF